MAGAFLNTVLRHATEIEITDMTGIMEFAGIWKKRSQVYATPAYYALRMVSTAHATRPVAVDTQSGSYSVQHGVGRLPDIADVPYLDVVAALDDAGDTLTLFCVNRSLDTDIPANIRIDGFTPSAQAAVQTLRGDSIDAANDEDDPEHVVPERSQDALKAGFLHHTFPRTSVTVITLHKRVS